jgi:hypothetical protein
MSADMHRAITTEASEHYLFGAVAELDFDPANEFSAKEKSEPFFRDRR